MHIDIFDIVVISFIIGCFYRYTVEVYFRNKEVKLNFQQDTRYEMVIEKLVHCQNKIDILRSEFNKNNNGQDNDI